MSAQRSSLPRDELATEHLLSDIGRRTVRGGAVMFLTQAIRAVAQFASVVVLARLLPPADFGLVAMAAALNAMLDPMKELGLSSATIQKPDLTHDQVSLLFWANVAAGAVIGAALFLGAPLIARFYEQPQIASIVHWLSLGFVLSGFGVQHWALLRRQMRFATVAVMETCADLAGFAVAIVLALDGAGYWALVAQRLLTPLIILAASWSLCRWRPSRPRWAEGARGLFAFGGSVTGTAILTMAARNIDQVLIGWMWGAHVIGLYERSSRLLAVPINNLSIPFYSIGMPLFSRLNAQEQRYRRAFGEMLEKLAMITFPGAALLAVTAPWVTIVLFGPQWSGAAPLVAWFGVAAGYQPIILGVGLLYLSQNRAGELLRATLIDLGISVLAIFGGLPFGAVAVAAALAVSGLVLRLPVAFFLSTRRGPVSVKDLCAAVAPPACAALAVAAVALALRHAPALEHGSPFLALAVSVPAAAVAACAVYGAIPKTRMDLARLPALLKGFSVARHG